METTSADILILGAGPGGYEIAAREASAGKKVILFEKDLPGGTCLNRGCIPTKSLLASAAVYRTVRDAGRFGINVASYGADYAAVQGRSEDVAASLRSDVESLLSRVETVHSEARILPDRTIEAGDKVYTAPVILIATGSRPARLNIPGAELTIDSDAFLKLKELPARAVVIGGGVIGLEFATVMASFGTEVTVIEYCKEILPNFDREISKRLKSYMSRRGINFVTGAAVESVVQGLKVNYTGRKGSESIDTDLVLMAVGRAPVVPQGCAEAGIELDARGFVKVNPETMQTSAEGIYAAGDVNGICLLAHAAAAQAEVALGGEVNLDIMPSVVFTEPECATVGLTEEQCKESGTEYTVYKSLYVSNGKALTSGEDEGLLKMICGKDSGKILGCHIIGAHAGNLISEAAAAMLAGMDVKTLGNKLIHAHPTLTELFKIQNPPRPMAS